MTMQGHPTWCSSPTPHEEAVVVVVEEEEEEETPPPLRSHHLQSTASDRDMIPMTDNNGSKSSSSKSSTNDRKQHVLWSCIARDSTILVEAGVDVYGGNVAETARQLLQQPITPGYEYYSQKKKKKKKRPQPLMKQIRQSLSKRKSGGGGDGGSADKLTQIQQQQLQLSACYSDATEVERNYPRLKGVKFHLYDHRWDDDDDDDDDNNNSVMTSIVWVFAAVYDPDMLDQVQVQSFLEKMVGITEYQRIQDSEWTSGSTLACQGTFAPVLLQRMQEITYMGKMAMLEQKLETSKSIMKNNIDLILEREEQLDDLDDRGKRLKEMALVFKKRTKKVRRMQMMQNAKYGAAVGTAIATGVAIVVVPPLVALL